MPYTEKTPKQEKILGTLAQLDYNKMDAGDLTMAFFVLAKRYWRGNQRRYVTLNTVVGAMKNAEAEFQRVFVAPYEDEKRAVNGDVE